MIVIGVDVHKQALTAVAVDEAGRPGDERMCAVDPEPLLEGGRSRPSLVAAVNGGGGGVDERTCAVDPEPLLEWARSLGPERLWALEDCRHVTRALEQALLAAGEGLVGGGRRLPAPQRRAGRRRGRSDAIDALAIARAALQEPALDHPRAGEQRLRGLKLVVDHRGDLGAGGRRCQQRPRWHLHELDPTLAVPLGALDRALW